LIVFSAVLAAVEKKIGTMRVATMGNRFIYIAPLLFLLLFTGAACAGELKPHDGVFQEIKLGLFYHDADGLWSGFKREKGADLNIEVQFVPFANLFGGDILPAVGTSINTEGYTSKLYIDAIWQYLLTQKLHVSFGLGIALHDGERHLVSSDRKALGTKALFHIPIEVGYRVTSEFSLSLFFDHMSNADIEEENEGLDTLGIRFGYRF
jgi:hypothetical protein